MPTKKTRVPVRAYNEAKFMLRQVFAQCDHSNVNRSPKPYEVQFIQYMAKHKQYELLGKLVASIPMPTGTWLNITAMINTIKIGNGDQWFTKEEQTMLLYVDKTIQDTYSKDLDKSKLRTDKVRELQQKYELKLAAAESLDEMHDLIVEARNKLINLKK